MHILYVLCIGWVLGMQVIYIELIGLYVQMLIPSVNEHYGHYFIVIVCLVKPWFISHSILLDCIVLVSYVITSFLHTMMILCCYVSGDSCSCDSRVYQILKLGVSEFCSTLLNSHIKSRVCIVFIFKRNRTLP